MLLSLLLLVFDHINVDRRKQCGVELLLLLLFVAVQSSEVHEGLVPTVRVGCDCRRCFPSPQATCSCLSKISDFSLPPLAHPQFSRIPAHVSRTVTCLRIFPDFSVKYFGFLPIPERSLEFRFFPDSSGSLKGHVRFEFHFRFFPLFSGLFLMFPLCISEFR